MVYRVTSALGTFYVEIDGDWLRRVWLPGEPVADEVRQQAVDPAQSSPAGWVGELLADLRAYLEGEPVDLTRWRQRFDLSGVTPFRRRVYDALLRVGRGETCTYGRLARVAGRPGAARAVGAAMAANPLPLFIPCHRVVGTQGLGGYGGGLALKSRLLQLEGAQVAGGIDGRGHLA